ncbi:PREDICTED: uncharacterized protein LOC104809226 [Tarenaya hassleriana]|uniref:uncharacterized protein LOC104809226 n=1 Tax=Tarenaya hassleriana TaxID=28532 RepID=UPI00053C8984|nr:PREDICTED: uncharacterized protein LOC104809226 [Tarenaya hassleriana]
MADPEKLTALKKVYADTILNTAKEAAARVVVSERKARGYQQELVSVRDEALRTLLRLKQMFDSKVKESEIISVSKQNKIEELEAQLGEAEDIVGELRMELRELQDELQKVTSGQTHLNNKESLCWENGKADQFSREDYSSHERSEAEKSYDPVGKSGSVVAKNASLSGMKNIRRCSYTLPSILTRRRDNEVLKEEFDQMIHTLERSKAPHGDMIASVKSDDVKNKGPSCKSSSDQSGETSQTSVSDSPSSLHSDIRNGGKEQNAASQNGSDTSTSLKTASSAEECNRKTLIGKAGSGQEEKVNHGNIEFSALPFREDSPASPSDKRFIKYTFKRKRKKDALSSPDGDDESGNIKSQKTGEKDNSYLELLKSGLMSESSRDSQRVAQVARQLAPLSEKKGLLHK